MDKKRQSPRIERLAWGTIDVEGGKTHKDVKLFPGGSREWDWAETGTSHKSGVQPGDVAEFVEKGIPVLVIGNGINGRLNVNPDTLRLLEKRGIRVHVFATEAAVQLYNELREKEEIAGLFHSTC